MKMLENRVWIWAPVLFFFLWLSSLHSYLLFHSFAEIFSIIVASSVFMLVWNSRHRIENRGLVHLGISYLFVAVLDTLHTLSFTGMGIFTHLSSDDYPANQFWVVARGLEAVSILLFLGIRAPLLRRLSYSATWFAAALVLVFSTLSILYWQNFPLAFVTGQGQTPFKVAAELVIIALLALTILLMRRQRGSYHPQVYRYIQFALLFTIFGEICFTIYFDIFGLFIQLGHFFKIVSFYLIYRGLVVTLLHEPVKLLWQNLSEREEMLSQAVKDRDRLFSVIAHDLRSPFMGLLGASELLHQRYNQLDAVSRRELIERLYHSSRLTYDLLENLLQWSHFQSGRLITSPEEFPLLQEIRREVDLARAEAERKGLRLILEHAADPDVYADRNMISFVVRNLIGNAIKFTGGGGEVRVLVTDSEEEVELVVRDTGVGIADSEIERLLNGQCDHSTAGTSGEKGVGLGLVLCSEFVRRNGGTIRVESRLGLGSRFIITLPRRNVS